MLFTQLKYALSAAEKGSFRKAAESLGVEQSAVSRRVRELEDELGVSLFVRSPTGIEPTLAGRDFIERVRVILEQLDDAFRNAGAAGRGDHGLVKIGCYSSLASGFLYELLQEYSELNPGVQLDVSDGDISDLIARVQRSELDMAFIANVPTVTKCEASRLWSEQVVLGVHASNPLANLEEITWDQARNEHYLVRSGGPGPQVHKWLTERFAEWNVPLSIEVCDVIGYTLMNYVAIGKGVTITTESTTALQFPGVVFRKIGGLVVDFYGFWLPGNDNPAFRRFLSLAKKISRRREISKERQTPMSVGI